LEGVSGAGREEGIGEVGVAAVSWDGLIKIDDCNAVNGEGTLASIDDTFEDGFDVVGVGGLIVRCIGFDGEAENNEVASDLGAGPDTSFGEAESLGVGVGGGVVHHVDESRSVGGRDLEGGGWGGGGGEEVALR